MKNGPRRLVGIKEAAEELGLAPVTIRTWIGRRKIAVVRLGRSIRIEDSELERLIDEGSVPALPERSR